MAAAIGGLLIGIILMAIVRARQVATAALPPPSLEADVLAGRALAASPVGLVVLDAEAHVLLANPRARELGVVRAGMADERVTVALPRALESGEPIDVEVPAPEAPGRAPQLVQVTLLGIGDDLVLASASDGTETMRLQSVRRDFVANVSHELKTPVAAVGLLSEAIADSADEPEAVRRFADRLLTESGRLGTLIGELIVLSRLQGADPLPDLAVIEVATLIDEAVARTSNLAEGREITLAASEASDLTLLGDRPMLLTALTNLISNGINYSPSGTTVSISAVERDGKIDIAVTDRGIGIAPEHQQRVFERFFRVDPARSRHTGGTGLGLAIVKHVAANHGGQAVVWSKRGLGSTFTLRLPAHRSTVPQAPAVHEGAQ